MRRLIVPIGAWVVILFCVAACSGSTGDRSRVSEEAIEGIERIWYEELRHSASERLKCPMDRISYDYLQNRVHLLAGCGRQVRFLIFEIDDIWVKIESFHDRASAVLDCRVESIEIRRLDAYKWEALGCGRSVKYCLECGDDSTTCDWVQDNHNSS